MNFLSIITKSPHPEINRTTCFKLREKVTYHMLVAQYGSEGFGYFIANKCTSPEYKSVVIRYLHSNGETGIRYSDNFFQILSEIDAKTIKTMEQLGTDHVLWDCSGATLCQEDPAAPFPSKQRQSPKTRINVVCPQLFRRRSRGPVSFTKADSATRPVSKKFFSHSSRLTVAERLLTQLTALKNTVKEVLKNAGWNRCFLKIFRF